MIIRDRELGKDCIQNQKCRILQVNRKEIARIRYVVFSRVICIPKRKQILKHNFELKTKVGFNFFCERLTEQKRIFVVENVYSHMCADGVDAKSC